MAHRAAARGARTGGELAVDPHGRRLAAVGLQDRARRAALLQLDGQPRAAPGGRRRARVEPERRAQRVPQPGVPGLELAVEVAARVAFAARVHPGRAARLQRGVDPRRHRLVGRGPVAVAAAEDGVAHPRRRGRGVVDPRAELRRVVRRLAVVGGGDDHDGALGRQLADRVVEPGGAGGVAAVGGLAGDPRGDVLGRAEVRAEEHQQRGAVPVGGSLLRLGRVVSGVRRGAVGLAAAWRRRNTEISTTQAGKTRTAAGFLVTASSRNAASR